MSGRADFKERRQARIEGLRASADNARSEASERLGSAKRIADMIPFGQPILVGHHSERRHRKDLARIDGNYAKGFEALERAKELESRAEHAEAGRDISSDDPDAPKAIRAKITEIERQVDWSKGINALVRKAKGDTEKAVALLISELGLEEEHARLALKPDFAGRIGVAGYKLTNWNSEIRRLKGRLVALETTERLQSLPDEQYGEVIVRESNNRTQLIFPGKPDDGFRTELKSCGFKWAPSQGAWQRMASPSAHSAAQRLARRYSR